ncbi:MAG: T9SS type A sorting domain-containing protein [Calditrichaeota bacterium]|nr:T9SS type A sorting domain-containing protein [Calditrichota bacterium]
MLVRILSCAFALLLATHLNAQPPRMEKVGEYLVGGSLERIAVRDGYAYTLGGYGLQVFDIRNPQDIRRVYAEALDWIPYYGNFAPQFDRDTLYIPDSPFARWDISDPLQPIRLGDLPLPEICKFILFRDQHYYALSARGSLHTYDRSGPENPMPVDTVAVWANRLILHDTLLIGIRYSFITFTFFSLTNPDHPERLSEFVDRSQWNHWGQDHALIGNFFIYPTGNAPATINCLDISDPTSPARAWDVRLEELYTLRQFGDYIYTNEYVDRSSRRVLYTLEDLSRNEPTILLNNIWFGNDFAASGAHLFTVHFDGMTFFDISDLENVRFSSAFRSPAMLLIGNPVVIDNDRLLTAYNDSTLRLFDISDLAEPIDIDALHFDSRVMIGAKHIVQRRVLFSACSGSELHFYAIEGDTFALQSRLFLPDERIPVDPIGRYYQVRNWRNGVVVSACWLEGEWAEQLNGQIWIVSLENPNEPEVIGVIEDVVGYAPAIKDDYIYFSSSYVWLNEPVQGTIISIAEPTRPERVGRLPADGSLSSGSIAIDGSVMLLGDSFYDISNPTNPRLLSRYPGEYDHFAATMRNGIAIASVGRWGGDDGPYIALLDVSDPVHPQLLQQITMNQNDGWGVPSLEGDLAVNPTLSTLNFYRIHNLNSAPGEADARPQDFTIEVSPNPFNAQAEIHFTLPEPGSVTFELFTLAGRLLNRRDMEGLSAGMHRAPLGDDRLSTPLESGIYILRLTSGSRSLESKIVVLK